MKLLFSETRSDYSRYLYPYVIWAVPEPGETPADLFEQGFLPASPQLDRFYLCRNLRVDLRRFQASSENRRILRKGHNLTVDLVTRQDFDYSAARREAWKSYADRRFGDDVMSFERLDRLMHAPVINHVLCFRDSHSGEELGVALLFLEEPRIAFYYYAFYNLAHLHRNLGMFMMTRAVSLFAERGTAYLHLGTCYFDRALYKTQFAGIQFFNGHRWSTDLNELKFLLHHDHQNTTPHLLQSMDYLDDFYKGRLDEVAQASQFRLPSRL